MFSMRFRQNTQQFGRCAVNETSIQAASKFTARYTAGSRLGRVRTAIPLSSSSRSLSIVRFQQKSNTLNRPCSREIAPRQAQGHPSRSGPSTSLLSVQNWLVILH